MPTEFATYLDGVKAKKGIKNDTQLAIKLGIPQPTIQTWKTTERVPSDEACIKIAEFAGADPAQVILLARKCGAKGETKVYWDKIFKAALTAGLTVLLFTCHNLYIMSNAVARWIKRRIGAFPLSFPPLLTCCGSPPCRDPRTPKQSFLV